MTTRQTGAALPADSPYTPRGLLNVIDEYLSDRRIPVDERRAVWDVLVALRGPDRKRDRKSMKHSVTAAIRAHAFPETARFLAREGKSGFRPKFDSKVSLRDVADGLHGGGHYHTHVWRALLALSKHGPNTSPLEGMD